MSEAARNRRAKMEAQIEAAVESVLGLSEVAMGVLGEVEGVVGATERGLQVAQQRVDRP